MTNNPDELLHTAAAAKLLDLSVESVRSLNNEGKLPALRIVNGQRVFRRADVEALAEKRSKVKKIKDAAVSGG